ncbi:LPXTG cell wall anchor domain-containing protein [Promicromonospora sukumoe]|uniref:LPXTG cell wall anchor domain-containing protein n=1 Tax=Promicromonospora sukumoe TaxID=88382 RepID=UPI0037CB23A4
MRKMTVMGASALLVAGLVASPAVAFAAPALAASPNAVPLSGADLVELAFPGAPSDVLPAGQDEADKLAATGASSVIGFTLIAVALVGGGTTLMVLRRQGALEG